MELRTCKTNLLAAHELIRHVQEEFAHRTEKGYRIAEEDLKDLQSITLPLIGTVEKLESDVWRYGRSEFGSKVFRPSAKVVENNIP